MVCAFGQRLGTDPFPEGEGIQMGRSVKVAVTQDIPPGEAIAVEVEGREVALFNIGGAFYAIDDACTHKGGPLSEGELDGTVVACPWHGTCFDVTTGEALEPPAAEAVARHSVEISGDDVKIEVA
jgi:nitrite reductase/ring-hydroxylating ferredoxin subunit